MKSYLVVYYSKSGNNKFLAEKISKEVNGDLEELKPKIGALFLMLLSIITRISFGNFPLKNDPSNYEKIILCGPIWVGSVVPPIRDFIKKYDKSINRLFFVTCCGSSDESKNDKFGYGTVFAKLEKLSKSCLSSCIAFPIGLILNDSEKKDDNAVMRAKLNNDSFSGAFEDKYNTFISKL